MYALNGQTRRLVNNTLLSWSIPSSFRGRRCAIFATVDGPATLRADLVGPQGIVNGESVTVRRNDAHVVFLGIVDHPGPNAVRLLPQGVSGVVRLDALFVIGIDAGLDTTLVEINRLIHLENVLGDTAALALTHDPMTRRLPFVGLRSADVGNITELTYGNRGDPAATITGTTVATIWIACGDTTNANQAWKVRANTPIALTLTVTRRRAFLTPE
jgi:hypothetical protein